MTEILPRVYLAAPFKYASMWRSWKQGLDNSVIRVISTWHDDKLADDLNPDHCRRGWAQNRVEILHSADCILAYALEGDHPNGTLIEVGMAYAMKIPIHLVGNFKWGTWRYADNVHLYQSLHLALKEITR